jgi:hypothetical protein
VSRKRLLATLGTTCVVVGLVGGGFVQQLAGGSSASTIPADGFEVICGVGALFFFLRGMRAPRKDATGSVQPPAKHQKLYVIGGVIVAVVLFVAVLFLTGNH